MVGVKSVGRLIPSERLELRRLTYDVMRSECDTRRTSVLVGRISNTKRSLRHKTNTRST
jgi:hypothetical protein